MKRGLDTNPEDSSRGRQTKRSKTIQACNSCKKAKTRCEVLALYPNKPVQCHRCSVLNNTCSYGELDRSLFSHLSKPSTAKESAPPSSSSSGETPDAVLWTPAVHATTSVEDENFPRPDHIWSYVKAQSHIDWSAPLIAIQELARQPFVPSGIAQVMSDRSLDDILSKPQIDHLLEIFSLHYIPWLNFSFIRDTTTPLLDLVSCTIASRHLERSMRSLVAPRLQKLTEDTIVKMIFNPRSAECLESIQSLLVLSLWSPICGNAESGIRDGRLLIASAISMSMNLHLNESSGKVMAMRDTQEKDPGSTDEAELTALIDKARLWSSLVNVESMLCAGSGRMPLSRRTPADTYFISMTPQSPDSLTECRDLRLRLLSELFTITEKARGIRLVTPTAVDSWYDAITDVLNSMDRLRRLIVPLEVVADYDKFQFQMLQLVFHCCRLLVYYHAMSDARVVFNTDSTTSNSAGWFLEVRPRGIPVVTTWARETLSLGEAILISTLQSDLRSLGTAPDQIFNMIAFAAGLVIGVKFLMINNVGIELLGSADKLLSKVHDHLAEACISPDHSAKRCAQLIGAMIETWEHRGQPDYPGLHSTLTSMPIDSATPSDVGVPDSSYQQGVPDMHGDPSWLMFQDNEFWSHFFTQGFVDNSSVDTV